MKWLDSSDPLSIASTALAASGLLAMIAVLLPSLVISEPPARALLFRPEHLQAESLKVTELADYAVIAARPLFNEGRRKDPPPPPPKAAPPPDVDSYRLVGLILSSTGRLALVERKAGGAMLRLRPGDSLDTWTVATIGPAGLELNAAGANAQLRMFHYSNAGTTANVATGSGALANSGTQNPARKRTRGGLGMKIFDVPQPSGARLPALKPGDGSQDKN